MFIFMRIFLSVYVCLGDDGDNQQYGGLCGIQVVSDE